MILLLANSPTDVAPIIKLIELLSDSHISIVKGRLVVDLDMFGKHMLEFPTKPT